MDSDFSELVLLAEGITVSLRSHFELERAKNSHLCLGSHPNFSGSPPNIGAHRVPAEKKLTMPPQKKSKKNAPAQANRDDHLPTQGNETSFVPESSNITDQEQREKLEALMKARAEKTAHTQEQPAEQQEFENVNDDDDSIDRELAMVQQKIQQL
jgi:hypothetical protein